MNNDIVLYDTLYEQIKKRDMLLREMGKHWNTRDMSPDEKGRLAVKILPSSLQKMSPGARQYAMATRMNKRLNSHCVNLESTKDNETSRPCRIKWGGVSIRYVSYDTPYLINEDGENLVFETEREMKRRRINEISTRISKMSNELKKNVLKE